MTVCTAAYEVKPVGKPDDPDRTQDIRTPHLVGGHVDLVLLGAKGCLEVGAAHVGLPGQLPPRVRTQVVRLQKGSRSYQSTSFDKSYILTK